MQMEEQTVQTQIRLLLDWSDLGLHCLPRPLSPKIQGHYGSYIQNEYVKKDLNL